jgi:hypothetical protein
MLPLFYLLLISGTQEMLCGCVDFRDRCYDDCPEGRSGDACRAACDERPEPGGH